MKVDDLDLIALVAMILLVTALMVGMSCAGRPSDYRNFPQYTPARPYEQRCSEQPDFDQSEFGRRHDTLFAELYSGVRRPADDEEMFYAILVEEDAFLTIQNAAGRSCLLLFSNPIRTNYYGSEVLGYDKPLTVRVFSASDIADDVDHFVQGGVEQVTFDKCVSCEVQTVVALTDIKSADDVIQIWAVFSSTKMLIKDEFLKRAQEFFNGGNLERTKSICLDIIECTDVDSPEAHLLLGKCAVRLNDNRLKNQVYDFLALFEDAWADELRSFEERYEP